MKIQSKSMDWFLYDRDLRHDRIKGVYFLEKSCFEFFKLFHKTFFKLLNSSLKLLLEVIGSARESMFCSCRSFGNDMHPLFPITLDLIEWFYTKVFNVLLNNSLEISHSREVCTKFKTFFLVLL